MRQIKSFTNDTAIQAAIDNQTLGKPYVALNNATGKIDWNSKRIQPDAELVYNGESVTGTSANPTIIPLNSTDTSIVFDVVMKDQSTPWVIVHGVYSQVRGTGSTQNVNVQVLPNIPDWRIEPQTLVYKKDGDQDNVMVDWMGWTGQASVIRYTLNQ